MSSLHRRRREGGAPARQVECFCVKVRSDCIIRIDIHHTKRPPPVRLRLTLPALRGLEREFGGYSEAELLLGTGFNTSGERLPAAGEGRFARKLRVATIHCSWSNRKLVRTNNYPTRSQNSQGNLNVNNIVFIDFAHCAVALLVRKSSLCRQPDNRRRGTLEQT